jgi:hypothetical protein
MKIPLNKKIVFSVSILTFLTLSIFLPCLGVVAETETRQITLNILSNGGGTTTPSGTHIYYIDEEPIISASPNSGYRFVSWQFSDTSFNEIFYENPITLDLDIFYPISHSFTLTATFELTSSQTPNPPPILLTPSEIFPLISLLIGIGIFLLAIVFASSKRSSKRR